MGAETDQRLVAREWLGGRGRGKEHSVDRPRDIE